ncbi:MAG TPA: carboxypeptidase-like regulatory domain-containing protein [Afifellaceae bacterium]|nr:carboxypeptidase-like regulatory domain-containing protein [Afifellaceae bacterium]
MDDLRLVLEVRDHAGDPVEGAFVTVTGAARPVPEVARLTGPDGSLAIRLPAGPVSLVAVREGLSAAGETVLEAEDQRLVLMLPPA